MSLHLFRVFSMCNWAIFVIFLCSWQFLYPVPVVKYAFPLSVRRLTGIYDWTHSTKKNQTKPPDQRIHYIDVIMSAMANHQPHDCLLNRLFGRRSKKTSKLRVTGLCEGNSPVTGEFPAQRAIIAKMFPFDDVIMKAQELSTNAPPQRHVTPITMRRLSFTAA